MAIPEQGADHALAADIDGGQRGLRAIDESAGDARNALWIKLEDMVVRPAWVARLTARDPSMIVTRQSEYRRIRRWKTVQRIGLEGRDAGSACIRRMGSAPTLARFGQDRIQINQMA